MKKLLTAATAALFFTAGCGDTLTNIGNALLDAAAQAAIDAAEAAGGKAMLIQPGEAVTLTVDDPDSDIKGASVSLPADALPASATDSLLTIQPGIVTISSVTQAEAGPVVEISLVSSDLLTKIELLTDATVTVPYTSTAPTADTQVVVGHLAALGNTTFTELAGATIDAAGKLVSGLTRSFSPFVAVLFVPPAPVLQVNPLANVVCIIEDDNNPTAGPVFDGIYDLKTTWTFNADGRLATQQQDSGNDGSIDEAKAYEFDANGNYSNVKSNNTGSLTTFDNETLVSSYVDTNNRVTGYTKFETFLILYDTQGKITSVVDSGPDPAIVTYDADDNVVSVGKDLGNDGTIDRCDTFAHTGDEVVTGNNISSGTCTGTISRKRKYTGCPNAAVTEIYILRP